MRTPALVLALFLTACHSGGTSPYAGQEDRDIKALSEEEVAALLAGEGMGLAKVAELNGYPGPKHVLDLSDQLELSAAQQEAVQESFDRMRSESVSLGERIVAAERELDSLFAGSAPPADQVASRLEEIGRLNGLLRAAHVSAHLEMKSLLSEAQVERYVELRGYADHAHH